MEISIKDLFRIIKNGLWLMVTVAVIFGMVAFGYSKIFIDKTYTTSVKLYVETTSSGDSSYNDLSSHNYATSLVDTYIEMLKTNNFYKKVADNLDSKYTSGQIGSMINFSNASKTEVFTAYITANSPQEAKTIADSVAKVAPGVISKHKGNAELKIVDNAVLPTYPSSPNVKKNVLIASLAGFAVAFVYVFMRELLDVKFKYNSDMTSYNDIPILASIPDFDQAAYSLVYYFSKKLNHSEDKGE